MKIMRQILITIFLLPICLCWAGEVAKYIKIKPRNNFILIVDKSGSMAGAPMKQAKLALVEFLNDVKQNDRVGLVTFNDNVNTVFDLTPTNSVNSNKIGKIRPAGGTALYDGLATGFDFLRRLEGAKIIIYLTDGRDNRSHFAISDIRSMTKSENVYVYGIGLGQVETAKLRQLSQATEGAFQATTSPADLKNIYSRVLAKYYEKYGRRQMNYGNLTIKSLPGNLPVYLSGRRIGKTPQSISVLEPGNYEVMIDYGQGKWKCDAQIKAGYRAIIDARESGVGYALSIASRPVKSAVFLDGTYIGQTYRKPITKEEKFWGGTEFKNIGQQLKIEQIPRGRHSLKIIAMPNSDVDMGSSLTYEFDFNMQQNAVVDVNVLRREANFIGQQKKKQDLEKRVQDSFDELDDF